MARTSQPVWQTTLVAALVGLLLSGLLASSVWAAEFEVASATELQDALDLATSNGEDDIIHLAAGTYVGNFLVGISLVSLGMDLSLIEKGKQQGVKETERIYKVYTYYLAKSSKKQVKNRLITVILRFVGAVDVEAEVVGLFLCQLCKIYREMLDVQTRNLLIQLLGQYINLVFVFFCCQFDLRKALVGETVAHNKTRMAGGAAEID